MFSFDKSYTANSVGVDGLDLGLHQNIYLMKHQPNHLKNSDKKLIKTSNFIK